MGLSVACGCGWSAAKRIGFSGKGPLALFGDYPGRFDILVEQMLKLSFIRIFPGELFLKSLKDNFMRLDEKIANVESAAMTYDKLAQNVKFFSEFAEVF